jgi:hypothetical protein
MKLAYLPSLGGQQAKAHVQQHLARSRGTPLGRQQLPALMLKNRVRNQGL